MIFSFLKKIKFLIITIIFAIIFINIKCYETVKNGSILNRNYSNYPSNYRYNTKTPLVIVPTNNRFDDYNMRVSGLVNSANILVPDPKKKYGYKNEADREENAVHHHYEFPESSWIQQHVTPKVIVDDSILVPNNASNLELGIENKEIY